MVIIFVLMSVFQACLCYANFYERLPTIFFFIATIMDKVFETNFGFHVKWDTMVKIQYLRL